MDVKTVVITGASAGIGAELGLLLASRGHRVVLAARRQDELDKLAARAGGEALAVRTDVTRRQEVEALKRRALEAFGGIDVWVNNAGRGIGRTVLEMDEADFDEMMASNVKSALYGIWAVVPHFQEKGSGHLINVSSFLGRVPLAAYRSAYSAAKSALNSLTANLRMDLKASHPGIHVSLVMPGIVRTEFPLRSLHGTPQAAWRAAAAADSQSPREVAEAIAGLIREPRAEIYTNPSSADTALAYFGDVAGFEERMARRRG